MYCTFHSVLTGLVWNLQLEQLKGVGELSLLRHYFQRQANVCPDLQRNGTRGQRAAGSDGVTGLQ